MGSGESTQESPQHLLQSTKEAASFGAPMVSLIVSYTAFVRFRDRVEKLLRAIILKPVFALLLKSLIRRNSRTLKVYRRVNKNWCVNKYRRVEPFPNYSSIVPRSLAFHVVLCTKDAGQPPPNPVSIPLPRLLLPCLVTPSRHKSPWMNVDTRPATKVRLSD
ncbi:hypothetical protein K458DRAFT_172480 [Lentithecium fluviatile CBS 122367]|uniref:Uncharacterized protein n=1 Tax=Lentithecium fluviatile CBS 122367 TaxID=1168545 RepID=A0A6G1JCR0_9PLEO|nr:hypothetical protein K458DRAFT_172480 [Lentithecium fluviatile CBS 122367]